MQNRSICFCADCSQKYHPHPEGKSIFYGEVIVYVLIFHECVWLDFWVAWTLHQLDIEFFLPRFTHLTYVGVLSPNLEAANMICPSVAAIVAPLSKLF